MTTLLTMSTKTASISNSLPPVAYTKVSYQRNANLDGIQIDCLCFSALSKLSNLEIHKRQQEHYAAAVNILVFELLQDNIAEKLKLFRSKC